MIKVLLHLGTYIKLLVAIHYGILLIKMELH